jgi:type II secretion system protein G
MRRNQKGFTLIELMIVVAIIGILAAIAIPQFASYRQRAQDSAAKSALKNLATAQEDYYQQNDAYANSAASLAASFAPEPSVTVTMQAASATSWSAIAQHVSSSNIWTYSSSEGGLQ